MRKSPQTIKIVPAELHWIWHDELEQSRRIWRNDWAGDQFEILTKSQFEVTETVCRWFGILIIHDPED